MIYTRNKMLSRITVFIVILALLCWIIPDMVFGNSGKDLKEAYEKALIAMETAQNEVTKAESDLELAGKIAAEAEVNLKAASEKLNKRNESFASASPDVDKLKEKLIFAQAAADEGDSFYEGIKETGSEEEINAAKGVAEKANAELGLISKEYNDANSNLMALQNDLDEAKAEFGKLKSAADEANTALSHAEQVLNEKNANLSNAQNEVEKTKAELEAYQTEMAEKEADIEEGTSDGGDTSEGIEEENTDENLTEDAASDEEVTAEEDATSGEEEAEEEAASEESSNVEVTDEGNVPEEGIEEENTDENLTEDAASDEEASEEEIIGEETVPEDGETAAEAVEDTAAEGEIVEVTSELVPEDEAAGEETAVGVGSEFKIDILFSTDENGYIPAGEVTTFSATVEEIATFQYFWDFGDGSSSSLQSPQYAYSGDGNYTLSLTILDTDGNAYSKSVIVNVSDYNPDTTEYWISTDASDEGSGTIDDPITIDAALSHIVNGDTLYFLPGTYNTSVNLDGIGTGTEGISIETETGTEEIPAETETKEEDLPIETETEEEDLSIKFIAYDDVVFDGQSTLDYAFYYSSPLSYLGFYNFTFLNYIDSAIYIDNEDVTNIDIVDNTFSGNGTAIDVNMDSGLNIQNNIIVDNDAGVVISSDDADIEHNIIAFNQEGIVVDDTRDNITVDYNDVFGNGTDYQGVEPGENDISIDPEFADRENLDFTILEDSPLYENNIIWKSTTDKDDYFYGEQVVIAGSGYQPFQDLIIKILRADGTFVDDIHITTDENGNFTYDGYSVDYPGRNYLVEITDADGNILEILSFTDCHHDIILVKSGLEGTGLEATFMLYKNGSPVSARTVRPSNNYRVVWGSQGTGTYTVAETAGPSDYGLTSVIPSSIEITSSNWQGPDEDFTFSAENCPVNIWINQKLPIDSNTFEEGSDDGGLTAPVVWHFVLNGLTNDIYNSDTYGTLTVTFKNAGTVTATASKINQKLQHFYIGTSADDTLLSASATVYSPQCGANLLLSHVRHKCKGKITLTKSGLEGTDKVEFTLTGPGSYSQSYTVSDASKTATWLDLEYGTYTLTEIPDPGNAYTYSLTVTPAGPYDIGTAAGEKLIYTLGAVNTPEKGEIEIQKTDKTNGEKLEGSTFELWKISSPGTLISTVTLGPGSGGYHKWTDLDFGTYIVKETIAPPGYLLAPEVTVILDKNNPKESLLLQIADPRIPGEIALNKTGLGSTDVAGFTLYNSSGVAVGIEKRVIGNGSVTWSNLSWDTYKIVETTTPAGYTPIADITAIVVGAAQQSYSFDRVNTKIVLGSITLNKTGLDSTDIAGFTLYDSSGAAVGGEKSITGNGTVSWTNLPWDIYKIVETTVPAGYSKMADITGIVVGAAQRDYSFDRINTKTVTIRGSVTLNKSGLDAADTAGFTLYNSSGAAVGVEKSITGNGTVSWKNLPKDTYKIVETTVPAGYSKMADITGIVVEAAQRDYSFDRTNTKIPPPPGIEVLGISELPFTGMNPFIPIAGISSIVIGIMLVIISLLRRKKRNPGISD